MQKMLENQRMCRSWWIFLKKQAVELLRTNKRLMNNYTKYKNSHRSSRKRHRLLRFKGIFKGNFLIYKLKRSKGLTFCCNIFKDLQDFGVCPINNCISNMYILSCDD